MIFNIFAMLQENFSYTKTFPIKSQVLAQAHVIRIGSKARDFIYDKYYGNNKIIRITLPNTINNQIDFFLF